MYDLNAMEGRGVQMKSALLIEYLSCFRHLEASQIIRISPAIYSSSLLSSRVFHAGRDSHTDLVPRENVLSYNAPSWFHAAIAFALILIQCNAFSCNLCDGNMPSSASSQSSEHC